MKKIYFLLAILFCAGIVMAQDEEVYYHDSDDDFKTIFGDKEFGGYGGIGLGYTKINDKHAVVFDARGGVIIGHSLALGLGGGGFINNYEYDVSLNKDVSLVGGYGGLFVEPILFPKSRVHLSFPVLFGVGGAAQTTFVKDDTDYQQENTIEETSMFLVIEPSVELEFNITRFMRLAAFCSYRFTNDLEIENVAPDALVNYTVGVRFKFGQF